MTEKKAKRLSKIAREFNVGISTIVDYLDNKGIVIDSNPNTKVSGDIYDILVDEYSTDISAKKESEQIDLKSLRKKKETVSLHDIDEEIETVDEQKDTEDEILIKDTRVIEDDIKIVGKIDLETANKPKKVEKEEKPEVVEKEIPDKEEKEEKVEETFEPEKKDEPKSDVKVVGKIDLDSMNQKTRPTRKSKKEKEQEKKDKKEQAEKQQETNVQEKVKEEIEEKTPVENNTVQEPEEIKTKFEKLSGPTVLGKIDLPEKKEKTKEKNEPVASSTDDDLSQKKKKRKRIKKENSKVDVTDEKSPKAKPGKKDKKKKRSYRNEIDEEEVDKQIKDTMAMMSKSKSKGAKYRREKRDAIKQESMEEAERQEQEKNVLKVTEFVSVSELANMMSVPPTDIISTCMNLGLFVSINQRLDAETMSLVAEEFNYTVEFVSVEIQESIKETEDTPEDLIERPPIVTVMGHVDHGKTKLLDHIRSSNVIGGEAGGITQHIGAYNVTLENERQITFLDTPGHEAFTAMRARGAQITDVAIIVVAADDGIKPQTVEAINHAQAAGVPLVFAINKIDKPNANPDKVKEELANMNLLVEDWGGKIQSHDISAKNGIAVEDLLEKVLLESELLELKANPNKEASGTVIESSLDKGRGYVTTLLVQAGSLRVGDILLAGHYYGRVKAMFNERGNKIDVAGPSMPVQVLGLNGAPQAGDKFNVMESDQEAREIATKREQLQREQGLRTTKHVTLDEIGRRIAIGNFQELNVIVKGDVDGSVEALSDSLIKLSTEEIQVNIKHKAVGQISESDVLLAAASNAIIIGFQVRPSLSARKIAEKEEIDIRLYSIIYDAIEEIKSAMEGMLSPEIKEEITATLEILETFKITKVGTIAGCIVKEGKIRRDSKVRIIRDGIVIYTGELGSLKRFKDDAKEVVSGQECGLNIDKYNDIKVGDVVEAYSEIEVKKKL